MDDKWREFWFNITLCWFGSDWSRVISWKGFHSSQNLHNTLHHLQRLPRTYPSTYMTTYYPPIYMLPTYIPIHLHACLPTYIPFHLSTCYLPNYPSTYLHDYLPTQPPTYMPTHPSIYLHAYLQTGSIIKRIFGNMFIFHLLPQVHPIFQLASTGIEKCIFKCSQTTFKKSVKGIGCGSVDSAVAFDTRGLQFDSRHWQNFIEHLITALKRW